MSRNACDRHYKLPGRRADSLGKHANVLGRVTGLLMLYGSRLAGAVVALVCLPLYARHLGVHDFGLVALILSGQALMMMLDLGMAALTGREVASQRDSALALQHWRRAEHLLSLYFLGLTLLAAAVGAVFGTQLWIAPACGLLYWALTLQNLAQSAMVATGDIHRAASLQALGVLLRGLLTVAALAGIEPSLRSFLASQLVGALLHLLANRYIGQQRLAARAAADQKPDAGRAFDSSLSDLKALARRGLPLFTIGIAGAAVLQADKLLIGAQMSPAAVAPYFLAATFSLTPVGLLAAPVMQFFQPDVVRAAASRDAKPINRAVHTLTWALLVAVVLPSAALWAARETLIGWWLHDPALTRQVAQLSTWLLPAGAVGAIGNVPLALIVANADFSFHARLSTALTALTLAGVGWAASVGNLDVICGIYFVYYLSATLALWLRCASQQATAEVARSSAALAAAVCTLTFIPLAWLAFRA